MLVPLSLWATLLLFVGVDGVARKQRTYTEEERQAEYIKRGHTWPPKIVPETEGWSRLLTDRFAQVRALGDMQMKWDGFIQTLTASLVHNYTEYGFGLTQAPPQLTADIRQAIFDGLPKARLEKKVDVIDGPQALFIDRPDLTERASRELQPILEAWSGIELVPSTAYGFRLYQNQSRLWMHVDRTQTHVVSCIYHLASSDDAEPWPIVIEDYSGKTNAVILKPGDVLLYESSKNFHGRPTYLNGSWYTSLFVHFYPKDPEWNSRNRDLDSHYAIPPHWPRIEPSDLPEIEVVGTSMLMPECPDTWCPMADADRYEGPGEYGIVMTSGGKKYELDFGVDDDDEYDDSDDEDDEEDEEKSEL